MRLLPLTMLMRLELRTCCHESLASLVASIFGEVLDEAASQVFGLLFPLAGTVVGVAGVKDFGSYTGKFCGHGEVEQRNLLGGSAVD